MGGPNPNAFATVTAPAVLLAEPGWVPADSGFIAFNYDPVQATANTVLTTAVINLIRVNLRSPASVTNVCYFVATAGGTLTAAENFAGLYNSAGTLVATSADQTTNWGTAGPYQTALTGGPFALAAGFYWVAILSTGTTPIALGRQGNTTVPLSNFGTVSATARFATNGTGTTLPASITPSANVLIVNPYWAGLS